MPRPFQSIVNDLFIAEEQQVWDIYKRRLQIKGKTTMTLIWQVEAKHRLYIKDEHSFWLWSNLNEKVFIMAKCVWLVEQYGKTMCSPWIYDLMSQDVHY